MLTAAASADQSGGLTHQFGCQAIGFPTVRQEMPMTTMTADNHIFRIRNGEYPCRVGFLSNIGMRGADQFSSAELSQQTLFKATD